MKVNVNLKNLDAFINPKKILKMQAKLAEVHNSLHNFESGIHKNWVGWLSLPNSVPQQEIADIENTAKFITQNCDALIVLGTGGSFLGAGFVIDILKGVNYNLTKKPQIFFLGNNLNAKELNDALELIKNKQVIINIISKSGTTLEPNVAFNVLYEAMQKKYKKEECAKRIICTTDKLKGVIKQLANDNGFKTFVVPDDIGGRYSVLTPVGLLPVCCAGIDIKKLISGAKQAAQEFNNANLAENSCYKYAAARYLLAKKNYSIDMFTFFNPNAGRFGAWLAQLFGESEGKDKKGMFPTWAIYPRDLHSLGQFVQEGKKSLFETFVHFNKAEADIPLKNCFGMKTGGKTVNDLNNIVYQAAIKAHCTGKTPIINIEAEEINEESIGYLIYFFELACAVYCMLLDVNPFNQPGVEEYKKNIKEML